METAQVQQRKGDEEGPSSNHVMNQHHETFLPNHNNSFNLPKLIHYKWWSRVVTYIVFLLAGQTIATLLGRLYFDKGGNSKWMSTLVQSAGFPILIPIQLFFTTRSTFPQNTSRSIGIAKLTLLFSVFGLFLTGDNLMYSYGLLYLPVSTYSLLCATQLAFNAVTSYFINAQKFTMLVLNSLVLLTISACLLAINADNEGSTSKESRGKYIIGFLCTIGASAVYSLLLSSTQFCFEKVFKNQTFSTVLSMQIYPSFVATCACVVGLFASGEWRGIHKEMEEYKMGRVSYVMTLIWIAITWQISSIGLLGLIFEVSSLFGNVISTLGLPLVPVFAVIFFHDKMSGVKVVSLVLAIWGFMSYIYQHYLDDRKTIRNKDEDEVPCNSVELC
ncbi:putative purine permease 11 [Silene latifolia]|uniref:putative purine permease 11 n=1 Tax=Silene latifolia TaxID=37657 RepID=UPI003D77B4F9